MCEILFLLNVERNRILIKNFLRTNKQLQNNNRKGNHWIIFTEVANGLINFYLFGMSIKPTTTGLSLVNT